MMNGVGRTQVSATRAAVRSPLAIERFFGDVSVSGAAPTRPTAPRATRRAHHAHHAHGHPHGLPGIDVSHWNHRIDWRRVRRAGQQFVILKATEGRHRVDHTYARNRRDALRAGLAVAAYHFALPDRHARDAI